MNIIIMETFICCYLVVLCLGNLQMLLDIELFKKKKREAEEEKKIKIAVKSGLSQFLVLQQKM